ARVAVVAQDLLPQALPHHRAHGAKGEAAIDHLVVATYSDYLGQPEGLRLPDFVTEPRRALQGAGLHAWHDALAAKRVPGPHAAGSDDLCVMPYTSGTTGHPKGCMHTHRSVMCTAVGGMHWFSRTQDDVMLSVLPLFHVTGMTGGMNGPLLVGASVVL